MQESKMAILIRCSKCRNFFGHKNKACTSCGNIDRIKIYYVDFGNKRISAGTSFEMAKRTEEKLKQEKYNSIIPEHMRSITFETYCKDYFIPHFLAKNTSKYSKTDVTVTTNHFISCFGSTDISKVTPLQVEQAINAKTELAPATRNKYVAHIKRMFNYAIELGIITSSPVKIKKAKLDNKRLRFLSEEEETRLFAEIDKSTNKLLKAIVMIAIYTGMRKGEIQSLKPTDIVNGKIYLKGAVTKSKKGRYIPISEKIKSYLSGDFDYSIDVKKSFNNACKKANIHDFKFHDLRHTFASRLAQSGVDLYTVKELLGHSSIELTQRYSHLTPDNLINAIDKLK